MSREPLLSVVIPTRGAPPSLARTLHCLASQTLALCDYEVVVVAGIPEAEVWRNVPADLPYTVRVLTQPGPGAARRRNAGAAAARADLLLFLDDDMAAEPGLLKAHYSAHPDSDGQQVVMGYLPPTSAIGSAAKKVDWFKAQLRDWWEEGFQEMAQPEHRFCYTDVLSGNFSLPKALFQGVGGFDVAYACREDYELGYRLLQAGAQLKLCPGARSWHEDKTDLKRSMQRKSDEGRADVQLARQYPELISTLHLSDQLVDLAWPSRLLRYVARFAPALADTLVALLLPLMGPLESLRMRFPWRLLLGGVLVHSYWQGVMREAGGWGEVCKLGTLPAAPALASIDLGRGVDWACEQLARRRPGGVRVTWHTLPLGTIDYQAGAEPIGRRHLLAWLQGEGALPLARAQALCRSLGIEDGAVLTAAQPRAALEEKDLADVRPEQASANRLMAGCLTNSTVAEIELTAGVEGLAPLLTNERQQVLVRQEGQPIGWLYLETQTESRSVRDVVYALLAQIDNALFAAHVHGRGAGGGLAAAGDEPPVSVIVCTHDRPQALQLCLYALRQQTTAPHEIIVVDRAPPDTRTAQLAVAWGVRYLREEHQGLDRARNRGLRAATGAFVAFVADDARPHANWIQVLARTFATHDVVAVTGMEVPAELATKEQCQLQRSMNDGRLNFRRQVVRRDLVPADPYLWPDEWSTGANMAFRRQALFDSGGFRTGAAMDEAATSGVDVSLFRRLIKGGHSLLYEPNAIVWHSYPHNKVGVREVLHDRGYRFGAYLVTCASDRTVSRWQLVTFILVDWLYGRLLRPWLRPAGKSRSLVLVELRGAVASIAANWGGGRSSEDQVE